MKTYTKSDSYGSLFSEYRHCVVRYVIQAVFYSAVFLVEASQPVYANPEGGVVSAGSATISTPNAQTTVINQSSNQAVIDWRSFNIASNELTKFIQPSSSSIALNRIDSTQGVSQIFGTLTANGKIVLINPAGIYFGPNSYVNVGGLLATTANISNKDFMNGDYNFVQQSGLSGAVINDGKIKIADNGMAGLVAPGVENNGTIVANLGTVQLGAGTHYTVDFNGNNLITFAPDSMVTSAAVDRNGRVLKNGVSNNGKIIANGGQVFLTANVAKGIVDNSINMGGVVVARSVGQRNGVITLSGGSENTVYVSGKSKAHHIKIKGHNTVVTGTINTEDNGFLETSGDYLDVNSATLNLGSGTTWLLDPYNINITNSTTSNNTGSPNFYPNGNSSQIAASLIVSRLNSGNNVIVTTNAPGNPGVQAGNLTVDAGITTGVNPGLVWTTSNSLTLIANNNLIINSPITGTLGTLNLSAANTAKSVTTGANGSINVANFNLQQGQWYQDGSVATPTANFQANAFQLTPGTQFIRAVGGNGSSGSPYQLKDIYGVQGIGSTATTQGYSYILNNNIVANLLGSSSSNTANWNSGAGFVPISNYTGTFNGSGYTLSGLTIKPLSTSASNIGLFGTIGASATVKNLTLTSENIGIPTGGGSNVGGLAALNQGTIQNVNLTGTNNIYGYNNVGGLVATNSGTIDGANVNATVSGPTTVGLPTSTVLGGVVGTNNAGATLKNITDTSSVSGSVGVGGLVGINYGTIDGSTINIALTGSASTVVGSMAGGIVGVNKLGGVIKNFIDPSFGTIGSTTIDDDYVGGIAGLNYGNIDTITLDGITINSRDTNGGITGVNESTGTITGAINIGLTNFITQQARNGVGLIAGDNYGTISNGSGVNISVSTNNKILSGNAAGAIVGANSGTLSNFNIPLPNISLTNMTFVGGLVGINIGTISNSTVNNNVSSAYNGLNNNNQIGGLVGWNQSTGKIINSRSNGATIVGGHNVGGLVGQNEGQITDSSVSGATVNVGGISGRFNTGGLVGYNSGGSITNSSVSTTNVVGAVYVGGLVGQNTTSGSISNTSASGSVIGSNSNVAGTGGLVGLNDGAVSNSTSSTVVTGTINVGGLIGNNSGQVTGNSNSAGTVSGQRSVGGFIGLNSANLCNGTSLICSATHIASNLYSTDTVKVLSGPVIRGFGAFIGTNTGDLSNINITTGNMTDSSLFNAERVGGLVGDLEGGTVSNSSNQININGGQNTGGLIGWGGGGSITDSYNTANVTTSNSNAGGLVGGNFISINKSYSTGNVSGPIAIGGLVGVNNGSITSSYAITGSVSGSINVGGLVGRNTGSINNSYSTENVTGNINLGGLVGDNQSTASITGVSYSTGTVGDSSTASSVVGGLIGLNEAGASLSGTLTSSGNVQGNNKVGGFIGQNNSVVTGSVITPTNIFSATGTVSVSGANPIYFGGLVGYNTGTIAGIAISAPLFSNLAVLANDVGGLAGYNSGTIGANSFATSSAISVMGNNVVGGLIGVEAAGSTLLGNISSSGAVTGFGTIGGLIGQNDTNLNDSSNLITTTSTITMTSASGTIAGGLIGLNTGTLTSFNISLPNINVIGNGVGGLVGSNTGAIFNSSTQNNVTGAGSVGGMAGINSGTIDPSFSSGTVTGTIGVGGFVGTNSGNIIDSSASGNVSGIQSVGGFIGINTGGTLTNVHSTGSVMGNNRVGGFVGSNSGSIDDASNLIYGNGVISSTGASPEYFGGFVGYNTGALTNFAIVHPSSPGNLAAAGSPVNAILDINVPAAQYVGGLAGYNAGTINGAYSTINVTGNNYAGGLVGQEAGGSILNAYSTGVVQAAGATVGGLIGQMTGGTVTNTFAAGYLIGSTKGGLIGNRSAGSVSASYFDWESTGVPALSSGIGSGSATGTTITSKTTNGLMTAAIPGGWSSSVWGIIPNNSFPYLKVFFTNPKAVSGTLGNTGNNLTNLVQNGTQIPDYYYSGANGFFYFLENSGLTSGAAELIFTNSGPQSNLVTLLNGNGVANISSAVNTLTLDSTAGVVSNSTLATALGGFSNPNILYTTSGNNVIVNPSNVNPGDDYVVTGSHAYQINGDITANLAGGMGNITIYTPAVLTTDSTISGNNIIFNNTLDGAQSAVFYGNSATFNGFVGGITPLNALTMNIPTYINGGGVTTIGDQNYNSSLTIGVNNATLTAPDVYINNGVSGSQALSIDAVNTVITGSVFLPSLDVMGTGSVNSFTLNSGVPQQWVVTGTDAGNMSITGELATGAFSNIQNITGGSNTDYFTFNDGTKITGLVDGAAGNNSVDFSPYFNPISVHMVDVSNGAGIAYDSNTVFDFSTQVAAFMNMGLGGIGGGEVIGNSKGFITAPAGNTIVITYPLPFPYDEYFSGNGYISDAVNFRQFLFYKPKPIEPTNFPLTATTNILLGYGGRGCGGLDPTSSYLCEKAQQEANVIYMARKDCGINDQYNIDKTSLIQITVPQIGLNYVTVDGKWVRLEHQKPNVCALQVLDKLEKKV